jgi:hypothetical protein
LLRQRYGLIAPEPLAVIDAVMDGAPVQRSTPR